MLGALALATVLMLATPVAASGTAETTSIDYKDKITCEDDYGEDTVAVIRYSEVSEISLWYDADEWAEAALEKCNLEGREKRELAGEVRAHAIGEVQPIGNPAGKTIDMMVGHEAMQCDGQDWPAGSEDDCGDPQEDKYTWLM
ncbi:hypothetical protein [Haloarchaeobius sp. HME9146]|uniref:hypothetical protein n=1 Tax=Haloarchaeobius sp. HME9146 TaxID=2978732 RepID=UPI0021BFA507|nr:hypothetical protein [Haloarchaeobius sp. HME9146]MCT9096247.1 hypothetical protein [Haloarchaeobius sp. HME9146]